MLTISNILSHQRKQAKEQNIMPTPTTDQRDTFEQRLESVCVDVNDKLHAQARKIIADSKAKRIDLTKSDINTFVESIDPSIWKILLLLTRSVRDASQPLAKYTVSSSKKVHCFYILCVLLFTTNNQCNTPVHVTLTDLLDSHIENSEKIKILNRLGAVASSDTHARYRHTIVQEMKEKGNKYLREKSVVLSIDNIDYLQSHAAVYSGDQHRSWHGTTIQALASNKTQGETPTSAHPAVSCSRPIPSLASLPPVRQTPSLGSTAGPCPPSQDNKAGPLPARPTPSLGNTAPPSLARVPIPQGQPPHWVTQLLPHWVAQLVPLLQGPHLHQ